MNLGRVSQALDVLNILAKREGKPSQETNCRLSRAFRIMGKFQEAAEACKLVKLPLLAADACGCEWPGRAK
jgi:hypothetical protein